MASLKDRLARVKEGLLRASRDRLSNYFAPAPNVRARDVLREIPSAAVTVGKGIGGLLPGVKNFFGETVPQTIAAPYYLSLMERAGPEGARFFNPERDIPSVFKTNKQIASEALQAALEVGTLARAPKIAALSRVSPILSRATAGAGLMGAYGAAQAGAQGKSNEEILREARKGAAIGAPIGALMPYIANIPIGRKTLQYLKRAPGQLRIEAGLGGLGRRNPLSLINAPIPTEEIVWSHRAMIDGKPMMGRVPIPTYSEKLPDKTEIIRNARTNEAVSIRNPSPAFIKRLKGDDISLGLSTKDVSLTPEPPVKAVSAGARRIIPVKQPKTAGQERNIRIHIKNIADIDPRSAKDISSFDASFKSVYRNFAKFFGRDYETVKRRLLDPFDYAKGDWIAEQEMLANRLKKEIIDGLGIKPRSRESALVQKFGEKKISLAELQRVAPGAWQSIVKADQWFRQEYDRLLNEVNAVRAIIYRGNPSKLIPRRQDYYRHFQELTGLEGVKNLFSIGANIPTELAGRSAYVTRPKSKFLSFVQRRLGERTEYDAVKGYLNYVKGAAYAKHIDPHIGRFRRLADELRKRAEQLEDPTYGSRFVQYLEDFANVLSGKTIPLDRSLQDMFGRSTFRAIDLLNRRVKANVILGNLSSSTAQAGNIPQIIANAGIKNFIMGMADTMLGINRPNKAMSRSIVIKERYAKDIAEAFDTGVLASTKKFALWITRALDEAATKAGWNAFYRQGVARGVANPVKYADDLIRDMVGGRGIGELPLAQQSRIIQLVAPFQVEVQNLWHVLGKNVGNREFGKILKFALGAYAFNRIAERLRGSGVTFDPVQAVIEAVETYQEEGGGKIGTARAGGRLAGEVLSNVMFGQTLAGLYPEHGVKIGEETITRKELFGREDPTRFGAGLLAAGGIRDPLYKILPPFGGEQIKRTIGGLKTVGRGYAESRGGRVQYPVEQNLFNYVKGALFGRQALPEAQRYYREGRQPLGEIQSQIFKAGGREIYDRAMASRPADKELDILRAGKTAKKDAPRAIAEGIYRLSDGRIAYRTSEGYKTAKTVREALLEPAKDQFRQSGKPYAEYGGLVFRRSKTGEVSVQTKLDFEVDLLSAKLVSAKRKDNLREWIELADRQLQLLQLSLADPSLDTLERAKIQNQIDSLLGSAEKYIEYGGFRKPRKPKRMTIPSAVFSGGNLPAIRPPAVIRRRRIVAPKTTSRITGAYLRGIAPPAKQRRG